MISISRAQTEDLEAILKLQYAAYQSEALLHDNFTIQPLTQTLDQVIEEYHKGVILKAVLAAKLPAIQDDVIIGSVRAFLKNDVVYIGKLMVHPEHQGNGLGRLLLAAIEKEFSGYRYELFTACKNYRNLHLYETSGYTRFKDETGEDGIRFAFFEKFEKAV